MVLYRYAADLRHPPALALHKLILCFQVHVQCNSSIKLERSRSSSPPLDDMGNNQSTANRHHRLAKPKTNKNSLGLVSDSPASASSRYADRSAKSRYQIRETTPLSPLDTESGSGDWSKDEDAVGQLAPCPRGRPLSMISRSNSRANSRANSRTNSRTNSLSCFGSRHGSAAKLSDLHDSKASVATHTQVDLDAAIRLLQEIKKNGSPEDLAALRKCNHFNHRIFQRSGLGSPFSSILGQTNRSKANCVKMRLSRTLRHYLSLSQGLVVEPQ
jgi:hypothetical protein